MHRHSPVSGMLRRLAAAVFVAAGLVGPAAATQLLVSVTADAINDGDGCSLREALINANTNSKNGSPECARGSATETDVIILPPESISVTGVLPVTENLSIRGGGGAFTTLDARYGSRILDVAPGVSLDIHSVRLQRGAANDQGGAIRVQAGGSLTAEYLVVTLSRVASGSASGAGGGIYLAGGVVANISRSELSYNEALGAGGVGGGLYCAAGCDLTLNTSTVSGNKAAVSGAGLQVEGTARLGFSTLTSNLAPAGAGIMASGTLDMFATISADNGSGNIGADLDCTGSTFAVTAGQTFAEMPGVDCGSVGGVFGRASLPSELPSDVLYHSLGTSFEGASGETHRIDEDFAPFLVGKIAASDLRCSTLLDQHGRKRQPGLNCDLGALQWPMLAIWQMGFTMFASEPGRQIYIRLGDPAGVDGALVRVRAVTGIGETCTNFSRDIQFAPGEGLKTFFVDPSEVFPLPGLNRSSRVCEMSAEIVSGSFVGSTAGVLRAKIIGNPVTTAALSIPEVGRYLDFGMVPVGAGGVRSLLLTPDVGGFAVTRVTLSGDDRSRFEVASPAATETAVGSGVYVLSAPMVVADRASGGSAVQIRCRPGALGDFEAELTVSTDSLVYGDLVYGVRCSSGHLLSMALLDAYVSEKDGPAMRIALTLDSPCLLDGDGLEGDDNDGVCFTAQFDELPGTATAGVDYQSIAGPVVFLPGEQQKILDVRVIDDTEVEDNENLVMRLTLPTSGFLAMASERVVTMRIDEDDTLSRIVKAFIRDLPSTAAPGVTLPFQVQVHNRGNALLRGVRVEIALEQPMWIRSFALLGANCSVASTKRRALCIVSTDLLPNQKPLLDGSGNELTVEADEADLGRRDDGDWVTVYGRLETADMKKPPIFDVYGAVSLSVKAGDPIAESAAGQTLMIDAPPIRSLGGYPLPGIYLLVMLLLPFRRWLQGAAGRKTGGFLAGVYLK